MSGGHAHGHNHGTGNRRRLAVVLALTATVLLVEVVGALVTGSLALWPTPATCSPTPPAWSSG